MAENETTKQKIVGWAFSLIVVLVIFYVREIYSNPNVVDESMEPTSNLSTAENQILEPNAETAGRILQQLQQSMSRSDFLNACNAAFVSAAATGIYSATGKSAEDFYFDYVIRIMREARSEGIQLSEDLVGDYGLLIGRGDTEAIDRVWWACRSYIEGER